MRSILAGLALIGVVAADAQAQGRFAPIPESKEIELARSAAPSWFSDSATVYVFRGGRHVVARPGRAGACAVVRDHPESVVPICFDAEAERTVMHVEFLMHRLRHEGKPEDEVRAAVNAAVGSGEIALPRRMALTWMMSRDQLLYTGPDGQRVGNWQPHVMIYYPNMTGEEFGIPEQVPGGHFQVADAGRPTSYLVITTRDWSRPGGQPAR